MINRLELNPHKWYTVSDLVEMGRNKMLPIKSRSVWTRVLSSGAVNCINKGSAHKAVYIAKGSEIMKWIQANLIKN